MKKIIYFPILILLVSTITSFAQSINLSGDSLANLLCKKWTVDYVMMEGMKIERKPNAAQMNYEFRKDKTVILTTDSDDPLYSAKGKWVYAPDKKLIRFNLEKKDSFKIISLKQNELVILAGTPHPGPKDMPEMQLVCKLKTN